MNAGSSDASADAPRNRAAAIFDWTLRTVSASGLVGVSSSTSPRNPLFASQQKSYRASDRCAHDDQWAIAERIDHSAGVGEQVV